MHTFLCIFATECMQFAARVRYIIIAIWILSYVTLSFVQTNLNEAGFSSYELNAIHQLTYNHELTWNQYVTLQLWSQLTFKGCQSVYWHLSLNHTHNLVWIPCLLWCVFRCDVTPIFHYILCLDVMFHFYHIHDILSQRRNMFLFVWPCGWGPTLTCSGTNNILANRVTQLRCVFGHTMYRHVVVRSSLCVTIHPFSDIRLREFNDRQGWHGGW